MTALSSIEGTWNYLGSSSRYLQEWEDPVVAPVPFSTRRLDSGASAREARQRSTMGKKNW